MITVSCMGSWAIGQVFGRHLVGISSYLGFAIREANVSEI